MKILGESGCAQVRLESNHANFDIPSDVTSSRQV